MKSIILILGAIGVVILTFLFIIKVSKAKFDFNTAVDESLKWLKNAISFIAGGGIQFFIENQKMNDYYALILSILLILYGIIAIIKELKEKVKK